MATAIARLLLVAALITVLANSSNARRINVNYGSTAEEENEKILQLFTSLATKTANRLASLKSNWRPRYGVYEAARSTEPQIWIFLPKAYGQYKRKHHIWWSRRRGPYDDQNVVNEGVPPQSEGAEVEEDTQNAELRGDIGNYSDEELTPPQGDSNVAGTRTESGDGMEPANRGFFAISANKKISLQGSRLGGSMAPERGEKKIDLPQEAEEPKSMISSLGSGLTKTIGGLIPRVKGTHTLQVGHLRGRLNINLNADEEQPRVSQKKVKRKHESKSRLRVNSNHNTEDLSAKSSLGLDKSNDVGVKIRVGATAGGESKWETGSIHENHSENGDAELETITKPKRNKQDHRTTKHIAKQRVVVLGGGNWQGHHKVGLVQSGINHLMNVNSKLKSGYEHEAYSNVEGGRLDSELSHKLGEHAIDEGASDLEQSDATSKETPNEHVGEDEDLKSKLDYGYMEQPWQQDSESSDLLEEQNGSVDAELQHQMRLENVERDLKEESNGNANVNVYHSHGTQLYSEDPKKQGVSKTTAENSKVKSDHDTMEFAKKVGYTAASSSTDDHEEDLAHATENSHLEGTQQLMDQNNNFDWGSTDETIDQIPEETMSSSPESPEMEPKVETSNHGGAESNYNLEDMSQQSLTDGGSHLETAIGMPSYEPGENFENVTDRSGPGSESPEDDSGNYEENSADGSGRSPEDVAEVSYANLHSGELPVNSLLHLNFISMNGKTTGLSTTKFGHMQNLAKTMGRLKFYLGNGTVLTLWSENGEVHRSVEHEDVPNQNDDGTGLRVELEPGSDPKLEKVVEALKSLQFNDDSHLKLSAGGTMESSLDSEDPRKSLIFLGTMNPEEQLRNPEVLLTNSDEQSGSTEEVKMQGHSTKTGTATSSGNAKGKLRVDLGNDGGLKLANAGGKLSVELDHEDAQEAFNSGGKLNVELEHGGELKLEQARGKLKVELGHDHEEYPDPGASSSKVSRKSRSRSGRKNVHLKARKNRRGKLRFKDSHSANGFNAEADSKFGAESQTEASKAIRDKLGRFSFKRVITYGDDLPRHLNIAAALRTQTNSGSNVRAQLFKKHHAMFSSSSSSSNSKRRATEFLGMPFNLVHQPATEANELAAPGAGSTLKTYLDEEVGGPADHPLSDF